MVSEALFAFQKFLLIYGDHRCIWSTFCVILASRSQTFLGLTHLEWVSSCLFISKLEETGSAQQITQTYRRTQRLWETEYILYKRLNQGRERLMQQDRTNVWTVVITAEGSGLFAENAPKLFKCRDILNCTDMVIKAVSLKKIPSLDLGEQVSIVHLTQNLKLVIRFKWE